MEIKLQAIVDEMEIAMEDSMAFLDKETYKIVGVSFDAYQQAEDMEPYDHLKDWQQEEAKRAERIVQGGDRFAMLPGESDIDEYEVMGNFCYSRGEKEGKVLLKAIQGRGAFGRLKSKISDLEIEDEWNDFKNEAYKQLAREWCEEHAIRYKE
ncbi:hypothetical protein LCM20_09530 [Halobacillus litoralis]|uniref:UPF0158 family protein n=1 Tax=Halobacillus litoralis TaxID=45668 RepID=UPI001CD47E2A|nr:UPF0158 family protein [Halobacillus litoralis]MCA0970830.1 hypothetical protein [Halobacillus litoralis]